MSIFSILVKSQTVKPLFGQFGYGSLASGENDTTFTESYGTVPTYDTTPATSSGSGDDAKTSPWAVAEEPAYTEPETYTEPEAYTEPETYTEPEAYTATETYTAPETDIEPETYTAPEAATEPEEEPAAYEPQTFQNIVPETVTETAEAVPEAAEPEVKRPAAGSTGGAGGSADHADIHGSHRFLGCRAG